MTLNYPQACVRLTILIALTNGSSQKHMKDTRKALAQNIWLNFVERNSLVAVHTDVSEHIKHVLKQPDISNYHKFPQNTIIIYEYTNVQRSNKYKQLKIVKPWNLLSTIIKVDKVTCKVMWHKNSSILQTRLRLGHCTLNQCIFTISSNLSPPCGYYYNLIIFFTLCSMRRPKTHFVYTFHTAFQTTK